MELGPKRASLLWFRGPNSIMVVFVDPLGLFRADDGELPCQGPRARAPKILDLKPYTLPILITLRL